MTYIDTSKLPAVERLPGWRGRYFNSPSMTFAHYEFDAGASIHEHSHPQEEVYEVIEGELEITIDGVTQRGSWLCRNRSTQYAAFRKGDLARDGYRRGLSFARRSPPSGNARFAALKSISKKRAGRWDRPPVRAAFGGYWVGAFFFLRAGAACRP